MSDKTRIAVVEDNAPQRMILIRLLEGEYAVAEFANGEAFLAAPADFDAVLLDIEMPGLSGYDTCRRLREGGTEVPVIFVSAHDTAPERLAAYEAGGDDFITKPIAAAELRHKVAAVVQQRRRIKDLAAQSASASQAAFSAMSTMGDLGVVIEFLRQGASAATHDALARRLSEAMAAWGLRGAVQVRGAGASVTVSTEGELSPLQTSVLDTMRNMGRIFEFGSRAAVNYAHVSLLVNNLPTEDPDKVGRLRDHLAVLAESADIRVQGMDAANERDLQKVGIAGSLAELRGALVRTNQRLVSNRLAGQRHMMDQLESLARTLASLGLSEIQENFVGDLVRETLDSALQFFDEAAKGEDEFSEVLARLERLAASDYRL
jgi:CheY-like chemotaxis protein